MELWYNTMTEGADESRCPKMDFMYNADNGSTSLKAHCKRYHREEYDMLAEGAIPHQNAGRDSQQLAGTPGTASSAGIGKFFKSAKRVGKESPRAVTFYKLLTLLIVLARLPFRIVLHPVFKALVWFLDPTMPFPTRADITGKYLPRMVEDCATEVKESLQTTSGVSVTFDLWMSKKTDDILSLDVHFIDEHWQWVHKHLGLVAMGGQTSGAIIAGMVCINLNFSRFYVHYLVHSFALDNNSHVLLREIRDAYE